MVFHIHKRESLGFVQSVEASNRAEAYSNIANQEGLTLTKAIEKYSVFPEGK